MCACIEKKIEVAWHIVHIVDTSLVSYAFNTFPFLFSSLSAFFRKSRIETETCLFINADYYLLAFVWWAVSITSRSINSLKRIISSVIAYYCVYVRVCVCIVSYVDVVLCQSINSLRSIPYLRFINIIVIRKKKRFTIITC